MVTFYDMLIDLLSCPWHRRERIHSHLISSYISACFENRRRKKVGLIAVATCGGQRSVVELSAKEAVIGPAGSMSS
ncbi:unnamed protein product [Nezara viridula]|uniref:Uncharacterized protein n=1 Tax=Nezara viridula TaxID=85310 RepID=A0A9P0EEH6_NEZVI|nr:unnamed protein product [Nezara viridula]